MKRIESVKKVIKDWSKPSVNNSSYEWKDGDVRYIFGIKHVCKKDQKGQYRYVRV